MKVTLEDGYGMTIILEEDNPEMTSDEFLELFYRLGLCATYREDSLDDAIFRRAEKIVLYREL